jgi:F-type H+-transporting ATPase subunit epsilon
MAENITFHLVSPERKLALIEAKSVTVPGLEGDMTVLPNHARFLTSLRPGMLLVNSLEGTEEFLVTGGFAEIVDSVATVLAEKSIPKSEIKKEFIMNLISEAEEESSRVTDKRKALVDLRLNDLKTIYEQFN